MEPFKQKIQDWIDNSIEIHETFELKDATLRIKTTFKYLEFQVKSHEEPMQVSLTVRKGKSKNGVCDSYSFTWSQIRSSSKYYLQFLEQFRHKNILINACEQSNAITLNELEYLQPERIVICSNPGPGIAIKDCLHICKKILVVMVYGDELNDFPRKDLYHYEIALFVHTSHGSIEDFAISLNETNKLITYVPEYMRPYSMRLFVPYYLNLKQCKCHIELYYLRKDQIINQNHQLEGYYKTTNEYIDSQNLHDLHLEIKQSKNPAYVRHPIADPHICKIIRSFLHW